jgi:hypothetical protein
VNNDGDKSSDFVKEEKYARKAAQFMMSLAVAPRDMEIVEPLESEDNTFVLQKRTHQRTHEPALGRVK